MPGSVRVLFFATAREAVGTAELSLSVPKSGLSVANLLDEIQLLYPKLAPVLRVSRFVRNGAYLRGRFGMIRPGDEFAIHPPYSGG
ncbi:MAG: MoaD/ThiS family protein [Thermoplasmata archaeon]|nr:MoaD/ThiS family protein [Thermoplasmata archaeon]